MKDAGLSAGRPPSASPLGQGHHLAGPPFSVRQVTDGHAPIALYDSREVIWVARRRDEERRDHVTTRDPALAGALHSCDPLIKRREHELGNEQRAAPPRRSRQTFVRPEFSQLMPSNSRVVSP